MVEVFYLITVSVLSSRIQQYINNPGIVIVPTCVKGTDIKRQGKLWPQVNVKFGKPIFFPQDVPISKELLHELTEALMLEIKRLQEAE